MAGDGISKNSKWGQAKVSVSVLADEIKKLKDEGLSSHEIYLRLKASGKTSGFSRASFYRWLRMHFPQARKLQQPKAVALRPNAPAALPSFATIQPATPVTGTRNGSALLGEDDDGTD